MHAGNINPACIGFALEQFCYHILVRLACSLLIHPAGMSRWVVPPARPASSSSWLIPPACPAGSSRWLVPLARPAGTPCGGSVARRLRSATQQTSATGAIERKRHELRARSTGRSAAAAMGRAAGRSIPEGPSHCAPPAAEEETKAPCTHARHTRLGNRAAQWVARAEPTTAALGAGRGPRTQARHALAEGVYLHSLGSDPPRGSASTQ